MVPKVKEENLLKIEPYVLVLVSSFFWGNLTEVLAYNSHVLLRGHTWLSTNVSVSTTDHSRFILYSLNKQSRAVTVYISHTQHTIINF